MMTNTLSVYDTRGQGLSLTSFLLKFEFFFEEEDAKSAIRKGLISINNIIIKDIQMNILGVGTVRNTSTEESVKYRIT